MTTEHVRRAIGLVKIVGLMLGLSASASADTGFTAPAGYLPGWQIAAGRAAADLDQPAADRLTTFAAPASGFDMGSYHNSAVSPADYGVAYDADGLLNIAAGGPHRIGMTVGWTEGDAGPEPRCAVTLSLEDKGLATWQGAVSVTPDRRLAQGNADLQPGLHPIHLHAACDQPVGARFSVTLQLKAPNDAELRPMGPVDVVHAGPGAQVGVTMPSARQPPAAPPTVKAVPPGAPSPAPAPETAGPPAPGGTGDALVATIDLSIREGPSRTSRRIGRLRVGQTVTVESLSPDAVWAALAGGGYVEAGFLQPPGAAGPERPSGKATRYRVGDCRPYALPPPETGQGRACLQPNGKWRATP